jgi:hypothetical protein
MRYMNMNMENEKEGKKVRLKCSAKKGIYGKKFRPDAKVS